MRVCTGNKKNNTKSTAGLTGTRRQECQIDFWGTLFRKGETAAGSIVADGTARTPEGQST